MCKLDFPFKCIISVSGMPRSNITLLSLLITSPDVPHKQSKMPNCAFLSAHQHKNKECSQECEEKRLLHINQPAVSCEQFQIVQDYSDTHILYWKKSILKCTLCNHNLVCLTALIVCETEQVYNNKVGNKSKISYHGSNVYYHIYNLMKIRPQFSIKKSNIDILINNCVYIVSQLDKDKMFICQDLFIDRKVFQKCYK